MDSEGCPNAAVIPEPVPRPIAASPLDQNNPSQLFHSLTLKSVAACQTPSAGRKKQKTKKKKQPKANANNLFGVSTDEMKHLIDAATTRVRAIEASRGQRLNDEEIVYIVKDLVCGQNNDDSMSATTAHIEQSRPPLTSDPTIKPLVISMLTFLLQQRLVTPGTRFVPTTMSNEPAGIPLFEVITAPVNDLSSPLPQSPAKSTKSLASFVSSNTSMHDLRNVSSISSAPQDDEPSGKPEKMMAHENGIEQTVDELHATIAKLNADMNDDFDDHASFWTAHTVDTSADPDDDVEVEPDTLEDMVECLLRFFDSGMGLEPQKENSMQMDDDEFMTDDDNEESSVDEPVPIVTPTSSPSIFSTIFGSSENRDSTPRSDGNVALPCQPAGDKQSEEDEEVDEQSEGATTAADDEEAGSAECESDDEVPGNAQPFFFGFCNASSADNAEIFDESTIAEMDETFESVGDDGTLNTLNGDELASGIPFDAVVSIGTMHTPEFPAAASSETGDSFHNNFGHNEDVPSDEENEFIPCVVTDDIVLSRAISEANKIVALVATLHAPPSNHMGKPRDCVVGEAVQPSNWADLNDSTEPFWDRLEVTTLDQPSPEGSFDTPEVVALLTSGAELNENSTHEDPPLRDQTNEQNNTPDGLSLMEAQAIFNESPTFDRPFVAPEVTMLSIAGEERKRHSMQQNPPPSDQIRDRDDSEGESVLPATIDSLNESSESSDLRFVATKVMVLSTARAVKTEVLVAPVQADQHHTHVDDISPPMMANTNLNESTEDAWDRLEYTVQDLEEAAPKNIERKDKSGRFRFGQRKILHAGIARKNLSTTNYVIDANKENVDPVGSNKTLGCIGPTLVRNMPMSHKEGVLQGEMSHRIAHADARRRRRLQRKPQSFVHPGATDGKTVTNNFSKKLFLQVTPPQASELSYTLEEDEVKALELMAEVSFERSTSDWNAGCYNDVLENREHIVSEQTTEVQTQSSTEQIESFNAPQSARLRTQTVPTRNSIKKVESAVLNSIFVGAVSVERSPLKPGCPEPQWQSFSENAFALQTSSPEKDLLCHKVPAKQPSTIEQMSPRKVFRTKEGLVQCEEALEENIDFVPYKPRFQRVRHKHVEGKNSPSASRLSSTKRSPSGQSSDHPECKVDRNDAPEASLSNSPRELSSQGPLKSAKENANKAIDSNKPQCTKKISARDSHAYLLGKKYLSRRTKGVCKESQEELPELRK
jgi:hypothetical protein